MLVLTLIACRNDGVPRERNPVFTIEEEGSGAPNDEPLLPLHAGTVLATTDSELNHPWTWAVEAPIERSGRPLHRVVTPDGVAYLEATDDGVLLHGSTVSQWATHPSLIVPSTVRSGMVWTVSTTGGAPDVVFEASGGQLQETPFGERRVWTLERQRIDGGPITTRTYAEGIGPIELPNNASAWLRQLAHGRIRSSDVDLPTLDPADRLPLRSTGIAFDHEAMHLSLLVTGLDGARLQTHDRFLNQETENVPFLRQVARWRRATHCFAVDDDGTLTEVDTGCLFEEQGTPNLPFQAVTHAGLADPDRARPWPGDAIAYGALPELRLGDRTMSVEYSTTNGAMVGLTRDVNSASHAYGRSRVFHETYDRVVDRRLLPGGAWTARRYLVHGPGLAAVRSVVDTVPTGDVHALLEDGLGGWTTGQLDADGAPAGSPGFGFQKTGLVHLRSTAEGREGLITDADGALWRVRLGTGQLEFLGFADLPEGHLLVGAASLGPVNGETAGETAVIATRSGERFVVLDGLDERVTDTTRTHLWTVQLGAPTVVDSRQGLVGVHDKDGIWVCEPDGGSPVEGLGEPLATDDTFGTCQRFARQIERVSTGAALTRVGDTLVVGTNVEDTMGWGIGAVDGTVEDWLYRYDDSGMTVGTSRYAETARPGTIGDRQTGYRDPWTGDFWGWNVDPTFFDQRHVSPDGNVTVYADSGGFDTIDVHPRAVGGGGRIVTDASGTWIQGPDATRTPLADGTVVAWADGRSCQLDLYTLTCTGSDAVERSRVAPMLREQSLSTFLADESGGYVIASDHIWRLDPDTVDLVPLDTVRADGGTILDEPYLRVHQGPGGRIWYRDLDDELSMIEDGVVHKTGWVLPPPFETGLFETPMPFDTARVITPDGPVQVDLTAVDPRYEPPGEGTILGRPAYRYVVGPQLELPDPGTPVAAVTPGPFVFDDTTVLPSGTQLVTFDPAGTGLVAVASDGLHRVAFGGTSTVTPWPAPAPEGPWVLGPDGRFAVGLRPIQPPPDPSQPQHHYTVLDVVSGTLVDVPGVAAFEDWAALEAGGGALVHADITSFDASAFSYEARLLRTDLGTLAQTVLSEDLAPDFSALAFTYDRLALSPNGALAAIETTDPAVLEPTVLFDVGTGTVVGALDVRDAVLGYGALHAPDAFFGLQAGIPTLGLAFFGNPPTPDVSEWSWPSPTGEILRAFPRDAGQGRNPRVQVHAVDGTVVDTIDLWTDGVRIARPTAVIGRPDQVAVAVDGASILVVGEVSEPGVGLSYEALRFSR